MEEKTKYQGIENKKILLVRPKNFLGYYTYPPLALICLGSVLEKRGYSVKIIDAAREPDYESVIKKECAAAVLVGITATTAETPHAIKISDMIKGFCSTPVVWGGWHPTLFPEQTVSDRNVDFVIIGEGDFSLSDIADAISTKSSFSGIDGIAYKENGNVIANYRKGHLNPEELPSINYSLCDIEKYIESKIVDRCSSEEYSKRWLPYQSSRGCPGMCTFCINEVTNNSAYRAKSPGKVLDEIGEMVEKYRIDHVRFIDDNFFTNKQRAAEICQGILDRGYKITWDAECRVDYFNDHYINDEFLSMAARSGLIELTLGIESGSPKTLQLFNKRITPEQSIGAVETCKRHNIIPRCSFIVGSPGEEDADILMTADLINKLRKINPDMMYGVVTFRPYPKCKLTENLKKSGLYKEPQSLREWENEKTVKIYTERAYMQPWQKNPSLALNVSFFFTLSSGTMLANHQVKNRLLRLINKSFIRIANFRINRMFFYLALDRRIYDIFYRMVIKWKL